MKNKIFLILLMLISIPISSLWAQISFAILPLEAKGDVSGEYVETAESGLYHKLIESGKYRIIERSRIQEIMDEQSLQLTGATDPDKAVEIGKILGVEKLIAGKIYNKTEGYNAININVIDVKTAQLEFSMEEVGMFAEDDSRACAAHIIAKYPLLGEVLGKAGDVYIVDLGRNHGLKMGDRLFIARKQELIGDDGEVLFVDVNRIGTLEVIKLDAARAKTKIKFLEDKSVLPQKGDLISPEPVPSKDAFISTVPLLPQIKKGKIILDDDMDTKKYLSLNLVGDPYKDGKLHMDARELPFGHAFCYYPMPYDQLENFIIEGEVEFYPIESGYNIFQLMIRNKGAYPNSEAYSINFTNNGEIGLFKWKLGEPFEIMPLQASPTVKRGDKAKNKFKVIAYDSKFDVYINDEFTIGFEHEALLKGGIGFWIIATNYSIIDDIKIWETVKK